MSIHRMKILLAFADHGSIGAAAKAINLSQPAVSAQIKSLEEELQTQLFDRRMRPPTLNRKGHYFVDRAREIIDSYEEMLKIVSGQSDLAGELTIGSIPTVMSALVPMAIRSLREMYPKMHIRVVPGQSPDLMSSIDQDRFDAALINKPLTLPSHMEFWPFATEPMVVLVPESCSLSDPEEILTSMPFIRFNRKLWAGQMIDEWLRMRKIHVRELMELDTLDTISAMVYHDLGAAIVPDLCVKPPNALTLKSIPLGPTSKPRTLGLLLKKHRPKVELCRVLFDQLSQVVENAKPATASQGSE